MKSQRLKFLASIVAGQSPSGDDVVDEGRIPFLQGCAEFGRKHPIPTKYCDSAPKRARCGSWLISVRAPVGEINLADRDYGIGRGLASISADSMDHRFLGYVLLNSVGTLRSVATGSTYEAVSASQIGNLLVPHPDRHTQEAIADFLDRETARIDQLIEKKERMIAVIEEKRSATISVAVTKGFGSHGLLKETASPYLPLIPNSWSIQRLKQLAVVQGGITLGRELPQGLPTSQTPYLRVANVQAGRLNLDMVTELYATEAEIKRYSLHPNDVLMTEGGDNDKLGRGVVWDGSIIPCLHQNHVFAVRPHDPNLAKWISLASSSQYGRDFFYLNSKQSTNLASISKSKLEQFPIALPQGNERIQILHVLEARLRRCESLMKSISMTIDRLREFRPALITAAVTGQIDVATWSKRGEMDRRLEAIKHDLRAEREEATV